MDLRADTAQVKVARESPGLLPRATATGSREGILQEDPLGATIASRWMQARLSAVVAVPLVRNAEVE